MDYITKEERIQLLKNLLSDPNDWISREILRLADEGIDEAKNPPETPAQPKQ